ncbi:MAG: hypothetical protein LBE11_08280 [Prevotellaceae bacterium]|jgi:hypothetical protein|nr:hypothetical protein [Prevotellaceae bacterium]
MKKYTIIFILVFVSVLHSNAQNNYQRGYIITNEQDTINGWVDFRTDKMNGEICRFKLELSDNEQIFLPKQIFGYRFLQSGKFYISKTVLIENNPKTAFLEYLIHGIMNLYFYVSNDSDILGYYIFEDENNNIFTISKSVDKFITKSDGTTVLRKDNKYTTDLNFVFGDIKEISRKLPTAKFTHNTMIDFVKEYHDQLCTTGEECIEFETDIDKKPFEFKFSIYTGNERGSYTNDYSGEKHTASALIIGGRVEVIIPRWYKSISALFDFSYTKNEGIYNNNFSVSKFEIDFGGKYTSHKGILRPTIEAGIALAIEKYPSHFAYV